MQNETEMKAVRINKILALKQRLSECNSNATVIFPTQPGKRNEFVFKKQHIAIPTEFFSELEDAIKSL